MMKPDADQPAAPESKPGSKPDAKEDVKSLPIQEAEKKLGSSPDGLMQAEAEQEIRKSKPQKMK